LKRNAQPRGAAAPAAAIGVPLPEDGRRRVVIEGVRPQVDCGEHSVKRVLGDLVVVEADAIADGHDQISCALLHRKATSSVWTETPMTSIGNDTWRASFAVNELGVFRYTVTAWIDEFQSWRQRFSRWRDARDIERALLDGIALVSDAAERATGAERHALLAVATRLGSGTLEERRALALAGTTAQLVRRHADRALATRYARELEIVVERPLARCSAWYEFFPRSCAAEDAAHGTFAAAKARLAYAAQMGFDVVYLPPIHPIGRSHRKGPNNTLVAGPDDPGSPWAIGAAEGGHTAVHPQLGTLEDFRDFRREAERLGLELALDVAYQCSPEHPYVNAHPDWFRRRADGTIQYAENPPKKYEDIYPFDFTTGDWQALWRELRDVVEFWIGEGVTIFRVDNPHTKPLPFWRWLIADVKTRHPETIFLAEAFARPRLMYQLAKLGFSQSYTYFTWRNTKRELVEYFTDLATRRDYFRPNLWPNTPDILHEYLQFGGRPAFVCRAVLAATLSASYGIYGPAFELLAATPRETGSEEYRDSEKYQLRDWDVDRADSLRAMISRLNELRRENPALQADGSLRFCDIDNEQLICYAKHTDDFENIVVVVVNLDPHHTQSGFVDLPLERWGIDPARPFQAHDLLSGARYLWQGERNFVALDPQRSTAHVFRLRRHLGTERDFDYFM
jgi:starch synthase (maltosyl-transferring)